MNGLRPLAILLASASLLGLSACTTPAPRVEGYTAPPIGTVTVFHRRSSGSFGTVDGPVSWTHIEQPWEGRVVPAARSEQAGTNLLDPASYGLLAQLNRAGQLQLSYNPPWGYQWPLEVGKRWTSTHQLLNHARGVTQTVSVAWEIEAREPVTVPAGTFPTWRVRSTDSLGETQLVWTCPEQGIQTIKRVLDRVASHPLGAGHLEGELLSVTRPR